MAALMNSIQLLPETSQTHKVHRAFSIHANQQIKEINTLIAQYNAAEQHTEKLLKLYHINALRKKLEDEHSQDVFIDEFVHEIENKLFKECQTQFAAYNLSMHEQALKEKHFPQPLPSTPINPFANMLANMQPEELRDMLRILSRGQFYNASGFLALFKNSNPAYHALINEYEITYLGGGNSKNFKITRRNTPNPESFVLRVDDRLGGAREIDSYLRGTSLADILSPIEAPRSITLNGKTNTLLITPVCPGGTPEAHSKRCVSDNDRIEGALNIYSQMGDVLLQIGHENCLFPDAKNSNWLLDKAGKLVISDTKSLLFAHQGYHDSDQTYEKNQWIYGSIPNLIQTSRYSPPEITSRRFNVDHMHGFVLGKNLYQYLTQCSNDYLAGRTANNFDFNLSIFNSMEGLALKSLIQKLVINDPAQRINVQEALNELASIKIKTRCLDMLNKIENSASTDAHETQKFIQISRQNLPQATFEDIKKMELTLQHLINEQSLENKLQKIALALNILEDLEQTNPADHKMQEFVQEQRQFLQEVAAKDDLPHILEHLQRISAENQTINIFLKQNVDHLGKKIPRMNAETKIQKIKETLYNIPVVQRSTMMTTDEPSPEVRAFQRALGTRRTIVGNIPPSHLQNPIFKKYKEQYEELTLKASTVDVTNPTVGANSKK